MSQECHDHRARIGPWMIGELDAADAGALEAHLASCSACRRERDGWRTMLAELSAIEDRQVPRPFFVGPEASPTGGWRILRQLPAPWRLSLAAIHLVLLALGVLAVGRFSVRIADQSTVIGFGAPAAPGGLDPASETRVRTLIEEAVEREGRQQDRRWQETLELARGELRLELSAEQKEILGVLLSEHERHLRALWAGQQEAFQTAVDRRLDLSYERFQNAYLEDLVGFSRGLEEVAQRDALQQVRMDALSTAVLEIASLSDRPHLENPR